LVYQESVSRLDVSIIALF